MYHVIRSYMSIFLSKRNVNKKQWYYVNTISPLLQTQFSLKRESTVILSTIYYRYLHWYNSCKIIWRTIWWFNQFLNVIINDNSSLCSLHKKCRQETTHIYDSTIINCRYYLSDENVLWWWWAVIFLYISLSISIIHDVIFPD